MKKSTWSTVRPWPSSVAVAAFTGSPGPGPLRRFPNASLDRLAQTLNQAHDNPLGGCERFPTRDIARVDRLNSRVVLTVSRDNTADSVLDLRLAVTAKQDRDFDREMIDIELSAEADAYAPDTCAL